MGNVVNVFGDHSAPQVKVAEPAKLTAKEVEPGELATWLARAYEIAQEGSFAKDATVAASCGAAFWATLTAAQLAAGTVGLSCAFAPVSTLAGACAVLGASRAVEICAVDMPGKKKMENAEAVAFSAATLGLFSVLGGRFSSVLPSDILRPGAFAQESIDATQSYATPVERQQIFKLGKKHGCHTCGVRADSFIADHMPPLKLATLKTSGFWGMFQPYPEHRFFPQCPSCSSIQAKTAKLCTKTKILQELVYHFSSFRAYHFTGFILGTVLYKTRQDKDAVESPSL